VNDSALQQLLDGAAEKAGVVGAQLAVFDGMQLRAFATGYRNLELRLPVTNDAVFQIGSTTKLFNAALVLSLVDAGKLDLDTAVHEYIRDFRLADLEAQASVTLRQLLSMSAGLDNGPYYDYGRGDDALLRYVETLAGVPQIFQPGTAFGYSNASTNIAGCAAASVMGQTWELLLTERIFGPLGLTHSLLCAEDALLQEVALGYLRPSADEALRRSPLGLTRSMGPAGAVTYSSASDLVTLACMLLNRGSSTAGIRILSEAAVATMHKAQVSLPTRLFADEWCIGPYRKEWDGSTLYGHSGTNWSGSSTLLWCPEKRVAIATVVNVAAQGYPFAEEIFDVVFPQLFEIRKPKRLMCRSGGEIKMDLSPYVGRFEAFGMSAEIIREGEALLLNYKTNAVHVDGCELVPLAPGRFLPSDPRVSGNRDWDIAFWGWNADGRASYLLQGVFPMRRTG